MDVAPTLLALHGLAPTDGPGQPLVDLMHGSADASSALVGRPQAFGRPLYEQDGWAVLDEDKKWIDRAGVQRLYDVQHDPQEVTDIADQHPLEGYPSALSEALGRDVVQVWRIRPKVRSGTSGLTIRMSHPSPLLEVWPSYDPRGRAGDTTITLTDGALSIATPAGTEAPNAIFVLPTLDATPEGLLVELSGPGQTPLAATSTLDRLAPGPERRILAEAGGRGWGIVVDAAWVPIRGGTEVAGFHEDVQDQLKELGYLDD
jgi:hypothetical protein